MEIRLLGPLAVVRGDRELALPQPKARAVLAYLALHAGQPVAADAIVEAVWGEAPPRTVSASLQNYLSRLRKALGPDALASLPAGYALRVDRDRVDVHRFERLLGAARRATGEERAAKLRSALALWRGPALADLVYEPFALTEAPRLEELRLAALEDWLDADLALGRGPELVAELEALAEEHPLRERLRGQLMLALYRAGRQADALEAYQAARRTLVEELGIDPSPALRELEAAILRQDPALSPTPASRPSPTEWRRKRVTVVFAEVTVSGQRVDPEAARQLVEGTLSELRAAAKAHGGTVQEAAGDAALAVFGVPALHEDDALRAVRAAVQLCEAVVDANAAAAGAEARVELRVGIRTGEVLAADEDGAVSGDAPLVAKLLAELAEPGEILLGPATMTLVRDAVVVESVGALDLRGRREPLQVFRLVDVLRATTAVARTHDTPLVGRGVELELLRRAFEQAVAERRCRRVVVVGEAGIGKTRLVQELMTAVEGEARITVGRCPAYGAGATYLPLAEVVARALGTSTGEAIEAAFDGDADGKIVAAHVAELIGASDAPTVGGEAFWAVRRFLERLARDRPLVVVLDDLHWAEPTFLDLVEHLVEWVADAPVLLACTARPELLDARATWADSALALAPLGELDAHAVIDNAGAGELAPEVRARIVATAEGNPLYVEQLLQYSAETGSVELPPTLGALLASRVDRLEPDVRAVLERAAVAGREFSRSAVLALSPTTDAAAVARHLAELHERRLVRPSRALVPGEDAFRFQHALLRDAVYGGMAKTTRAELHERFGDWLADAGASDEVVGSHLEEAFRLRAELGPVDRAARRLAADAGLHLGRAGIRAFKHGDIPATVNLLERAAALLPEGDGFRRELLCELGLALRVAGDMEGAQAVLADACRLASAARDRRLALRARIELDTVRVFSGDAELIPTLEKSMTGAIPLFEAVADDRSLGRAWLVTATVEGNFRCRYAAAENAAERAAQHYARAGWPAAYAIGDVAGGATFGPRPVADAIERCDTLLEHAGGSPLVEATVVVWKGELEAMEGRFVDARELVERARTTFVQLGHGVIAESLCNNVRARVERLANRLEGAERFLRAAYRFCEERGDTAHLSSLAAELADVTYALERYEEAAAFGEVARAHAVDDDLHARFTAAAALAKIRARESSLEEAEELARSAVELAAETDMLNEQARVLLALAEVLRLAGRPAEAAMAAEDALDRYVRKGNLVAAGHTRQLLGDLVTV